MTEVGPLHKEHPIEYPEGTPPLGEDEAQALGTQLDQPGIHLRRLPGCLRIRHQGRAARRTGVPSPRADRDLGEGPHRPLDPNRQRLVPQRLHHRGKDRPARIAHRHLASANA
jgi:hypothetical protein